MSAERDPGETVADSKREALVRVINESPPYRLADEEHVRGYKEEGTTTTPFDMVVLNTLDRFHLVMDVANRVPKLQAQAAHIKQRMRDKLNAHTQSIHRYGEDMPEIRAWQWPGGSKT